VTWAEVRGLGRTLGMENGPRGKKADRAWVGCWLDLVLGFSFSFLFPISNQTNTI
jgi:hypothetical protein